MRQTSDLGRMLLHERAGTENAREPAPRGHLDVMRQIVAGESRLAEREVVVPDRPRHLFGHVLKQRAARRNVDQLHSAADAEHRFAFRQRPPRECELDPVAIAVGPVAQSVRLSPVGHRVDVRTAGKEYSVERVVDPAQGLVVDQRNQPRNGAGVRQREHVPLAHHP